MKHRTLAIFFITMMALVASPQAWQQFRNIVATAHDRAEAEWWRVLLSVKTHGTKRALAPRAYQPSAAMPAKLADKGVSVSSERVRAGAFSNPGANSEQARSTLSAVASCGLTLSNFLPDGESDSAHIRGNFERQRLTVPKLAPQVAPASKDFNESFEAGEPETLAGAGRFHEKDKAGQESYRILAAQLKNNVTTAFTTPLAPVIRESYTKKIAAQSLEDALTAALEEKGICLQFKADKVMMRNESIRRKLLRFCPARVTSNILINLNPT